MVSVIDVKPLPLERGQITSLATDSHFNSKKLNVRLPIEPDYSFPPSEKSLFNTVAVVSSPPLAEVDINTIWDQRYQPWDQSHLKDEQEKEEEKLEASGVKGEYDPYSASRRWNAMASVSTAADTFHWSKALDAEEEEEIEHHSSLQWDEEAEDTENGTAEDNEYVVEQDDGVEDETEKADEESGEEAVAEDEEDEGRQGDSEYYRFQTANSGVGFTYDREFLVRHESKGFQQASDPITYIPESEAEHSDDEETKSSTPTTSADDVKPFSLAQIDAQIEIRYVPGKGRCCFAKREFSPGDVIFVEVPTLAAVPSIDRPLWDALSELNSEESLDLPPVWHLAALYSLTKLSKSEQQVILEKWVPDENKAPGRDVARVIDRTRLAVDPNRYERYLQVWRYNSFGHHVETEGLVLYNRISMLAHDCAASACWHYGDQDAFVLRARQRIRKGDEITISYVGDDDLFKSTNVRQDKLAGWLFKCGCRRCKAKIDSSRGFRCSCCGAGTVFFKTEKDPNTSDSGETTSTSCTLCLHVPSQATIKQYLEFEEAYTARLDETDKTDLADAEAVYSEAQRVFNQHWVLFTLDGILFDAYRDRNRWYDASTHQTKRIQYATQVIPQASYTLAWLYEERGDVLNAASGDQEQVSGFLKNIMADSYEVAMNMLIVLCGWQHNYTFAAHKKLSAVNGSSGETG